MEVSSVGFSLHRKAIGSALLNQEILTALGDVLEFGVEYEERKLAGAKNVWQRRVAPLAQAEAYATYRPLTSPLRL